jgi:hypothetical protein
MEETASVVAGAVRRSYLLGEALAELAASVVLAELAASVVLVELAVLAELEARVTAGSTTRNIEAGRHIKIGRPRTALAVRLAEIRWVTARREQGNR